jgi:phospholipid/cholesterol/gamma-HCH transport system ATP-binding protein
MGTILEKGESKPQVSLLNVGHRWRHDAPFLFRRLSLDIRAQELTVLMGPSGVGKSTILRMMAGLQFPTEGEVHWGGRLATSLSRSEHMEFLLKTGMLFQRNALFDAMTALENVTFPLRERSRRSESEIHERAAEVLSAVGLWEARDRTPAEMSGGMQKRLGIARALVLDPEIVHYDDPTAGLDPITSRKIAALIRDLQISRRSTCVVVTNDVVRAEQIADRILLLVPGQILDLGTPAEAKANGDPRVRQFLDGRRDGPLSETS